MPTTPRDSRSLMSCTLHDVQLPQSASASITTWHWLAISWRRSTGAGLVKVGFLKRFTFAPTSVRRCSSRSRNTSPRALEMSSRPTVMPDSVVGRSRSVRWATVRSLVGSKMVVVTCSSPRVVNSVSSVHRQVTSRVTGWLPAAPFSQPPIMVENNPAPPPACTKRMPPCRNFGSVWSFRPSGTPSAIPAAPRMMSAPAICVRSWSSARMRVRSHPASANTRSTKFSSDLITFILFLLVCDRQTII